jgi:hypothetical protein
MKENLYQLMKVCDLKMPELSCQRVLLAGKGCRNRVGLLETQGRRNIDGKKRLPE